MSRDPFDVITGVNLYSFVGNNPINSTDYLGLLQDHVSYAAYPGFLGGGVDVDTDVQMSGCCDDDGEFVENGHVHLEMSIKAYLGLGYGFSFGHFDFSYKGPSIQLFAKAKAESPSCGEELSCVDFDAGINVNANSSASASIFKYFSLSVTAVAEGDLRLAGQYCHDDDDLNLELKFCGGAGLMAAYTAFGQEHELFNNVQTGCITIVEF